MSESPDLFEEEFALRTGLTQLYSGQTSPEFDAQVLAALQRPLPWWAVLRQNCRPLLVSAGCSMAVTLLLVALVSRMPVMTETDRPHTLPVRTMALDRILDLPNLRAYMFMQYASPPEEGHEPAPPVSIERRRRDPIHKAEILASPIRRELLSI